MTDRQPDALAAVLLSSRLLESPAKPLGAAEVWQLVEGGVDLAALLDHVPDVLPAKLDAQRLRERLGLRQAYGFAVDQLERVGISLLTAFEDGFPERLRDRLGRACPVLLHVAGDTSLLRHSGVGIVGSRGVPAAILEATGAVARQAVHLGHAVVSGCAKGVDRAAMTAAFDVQGPVVGFPADRLSALIRDRDTRNGILEGHVVLATPFLPDAPFSVGTAMARNKLIYATAELTIAMSTAEGSGGTWGGATEALAKGYGRVAVWTGPDAPDGNRALLAEGAIPLHSADDLEAAMQPLTVTHTDDDGPGRRPPEQLDLTV